MARRGILWIAVTSDKYELPLYVTDSCVDLAKWAGIAPCTVISQINKKANGRYNGYKFERITGV